MPERTLDENRRPGVHRPVQIASEQMQQQCFFKTGGFYHERKIWV
jgi:hypothetical protein